MNIYCHDDLSMSLIKILYLRQTETLQTFTEVRPTAKLFMNEGILEI